jgi:hypothetical protein
MTATYSPHPIVLLAALILSTWADAGPRLAPAHDRLVWERLDLMPPDLFERVGLRALCTARDGFPLTTKIIHVSALHKERIGRLAFEATGEDLAAAAARDLNDDGIQEVLLRFSPPRNLSVARLVLLCFSRKDRLYLKAWETGPAEGLAARFVVLRRDRTIEEWGLEVSRKAPGATTSETTTYRYRGERLQVFSHTDARPTSNSDLLAWGVSWSRDEKLDRAVDALARAAMALTGEDRARALRLAQGCQAPLHQPAVLVL